MKYIVFRKESFINAKKVLNFMQNFCKWKESNKVPNGQTSWNVLDTFSQYKCFICLKGDFGIDV